MDFSQLQLTSSDEGTTIPVIVQPGAPRDSLVGVYDGALKLKIAAPPVEGAANERCARFLAREILRLPGSHVVLWRGERSRRKIFLIGGTSPEEIMNRLESFK